MAGVRIEGVTKSYDVGERQRRLALDAFDLTVRDGEFVSLVGPTGCGKTTVLRMVAGLVTPTSGRIEFEVAPGKKARVGMVFQDSVLLPWKNVIDNVILPARIGRSRRMPDPKRRAVELLHSLGLRDTEQMLPWQLSGGMRQRVAIARALLDDPEILLMDEPFGALDAMTRDQLVVDLERIWMQSGKTVMFVTHSIREAAFLSDRVVVISPSPGRIVSVLDVDTPRLRGAAGLTSKEVVSIEDHIRKSLFGEVVTA